jgi:hypothetical protein
MGWFKNPAFLRDFKEREAAAYHLYTLLEMAWAGLKPAVEDARAIRAGQDDNLPPRARENLAYYRRHNPDLLDTLLSDILD